jgi:hypothetical protein
MCWNVGKAGENFLPSSIQITGSDPFVKVMNKGET